MKQSEIEVFQAGRSSRGITPEHLAEVASYDCAANPLPICFGHPKSDTPAAGTISALRAEGNRLFATVANLTDKAIEGIKAGEWLKPSFAFFDPSHESNPREGKWSPRHLALLGAAAPGIPGVPSVKSLVFTADEELQFDGEPGEAIISTAPGTPARYDTDTPKPPQEPTVMEKTPEQIAADAAQVATDRAALDAERTAFAATVENARKASHSAIINGLVASGKVLPAEVPDLTNVFNALGGEELTFSADRKATPAAELGAFIARIVPASRVPLGDKPTAPSGEFTATTADPATIEAKARKLVVDEGLTFEAAVERVSNGGAIDL